MNTEEFEIHIGDCLQSMKAMPDRSVHCVVTSPPYFGLRDYGHDGQIGLEPTPDEFVQALVTVFREARRVLRDDGTLWLNLGDSYARTGGTDRKVSATATVGSTRNTIEQMGDRKQRAPEGLPEKNLIGIPWRVAFALQADGWILRQDIIWHKPNCMPSSVTDRCTSSHEHLFLLAKSKNYFFDHKAIQEDAVSDHHSGNGFKRPERLSHQNQDGSARGNDAQWTGVGGKRNKRDVWSIPVKPYKGAHFATFPPALIEPCILAGCPVGGTVLDPFGGSGTTAGVALAHDRKAVLCELNPEYAELVPARIGSILEAYGKKLKPKKPTTKQRLSDKLQPGLF